MDEGIGRIPSNWCAYTDGAGFRYIEKMKAEDQDVRKNISGTPDAQTQQRESEVDRTHLTELRRIVAASGIPSPSTVGTDGVQAFWTLVQHAADVELQKRTLRAFELVDVGVQRDEIALLADRIRRNERRPQIYGSQFHVEANRLVPDPIEDEKHVDARRAKMGMMPLSDYGCMINSLYGFKSP